MGPKLAPLLPAPSQVSPPGGSEQRVLKIERRVRRPKTLACNSCRAKKIACSGQRPSCAPCIQRDLPCIYRDSEKVKDGALSRQLEAANQHLADHVELTEHLRTLPIDEAWKLLCQLRQTPDLSDVLSSVRGSMHGKHRPSLNKTARALAPPTHCDFEFELMAGHHIAYPMLGDVNPFSLAALLWGHSPEEPFPESEAIWELWNEPGRVPAFRGAADNGSAGQLLGPLRTGLYFDGRLHDLEISYWTSVPISNDMAASAISFYLERDHAIIGIFDTELFLSSLVENDVRSCSAFLVSSLLYVACQAYMGADPRLAAYILPLFSETQAFWYGERNNDTVLTVAAIEMFSIGCHLHGKDELGKELLNTGRKMAERLHLFNVPRDHAAVAAFQRMSPEQLRMYAHASWGTYNWLSIHIFYFLDEPIHYPPTLPMPGATESPNHGPWPPLPELPSFMGKTLPTLCKLSTIVQEAAAVYIDRKNNSIRSNISLAFAESKYQQLLAWTDTFAGDMACGLLSPTHVLIFHTFFHSAVLHIFRPFVQSSESCHLKTFSSRDSEVKATFTASVNQLKRILYLYHAQRGEAPFSFFINVGLVLVAHAVLNNADESDWQLYFLLCIRGWQDLYFCFPIMAHIMKACLSMAVQRGLMTVATAQRLLSQLQKSGSHHLGEQPLSSTIVDFDLAITDSHNAGTQAMAAKFDELALFDEFTVDGGEMEQKPTEDGSVRA